MLAAAAMQSWYADQEWKHVIDLADRLKRRHGRVILDGDSDDAMHRQFWMIAIHVAAEESYGTDGVALRLQRATEYRDAAVSMLGPPQDEFDAALIFARLKVNPEDAGALALYQEHMDQLRARLEGAEHENASPALLTALSEELDSGVKAAPRDSTAVSKGKQ
jgi:hypothetical protein